jgi:hypothetical protein
MNRRKFFKIATSTVAVAAVPTTLFSAALMTKVEKPQPIEDHPVERMRMSSDGSLSFNTGSERRLTINPSGFAGIGITPPSCKVKVSE